MPDLTGFPALDVLIGLALMFFVLSTVCSAVNEAIAALLAWRAKNLEQAIRNLLGGKGPGLGERFSGTRSGKAAAKYVEAQVKAAEEEANAIAGATEAQIKQAVDAARAKANAAVHDLTQEVFEHWRIRSLVRRPGASFLRRLPVVGWRGPSYIPPHAFALALEETLFPEGDSDDAFTHAKDKID